MKYEIINTAFNDYQLEYRTIVFVHAIIPGG